MLESAACVLRCVHPTARDLASFCRPSDEAKMLPSPPDTPPRLPLLSPPPPPPSPPTPPPPPPPAYARSRRSRLPPCIRPLGPTAGGGPWLDDGRLYIWCVSVRESDARPLSRRRLQLSHAAPRTQEVPTAVGPSENTRAFWRRKIIAKNHISVISESNPTHHRIVARGPLRDAQPSFAVSACGASYTRTGPAPGEDVAPRRGGWGPDMGPAVLEGL
jgi:hypothetical protein